MWARHALAREGRWADWLPSLALVGAAVAAGYMIAYLPSPFIRGLRGRRTALGVIPARYASSRFPGKPLALILGKPMIQRTWEQAMKAVELDHVVVATEDSRIAQCCRSFGAEVVMTNTSCANGTERCHEAVKRLKRKFDIVVNIQGDEPLIEPGIINGVVLALKTHPEANFSTAVTALKSNQAADPNRVKCVLDRNGYALYFSRGIIPFNKRSVANRDFPYLLHLGIQCYDAEYLAIYAKLYSTPLQVEEDLEQLKILEHGYKIKAIKVDHEAHGVDTPEDIESIEALMRARHLT